MGMPRPALPLLLVVLLLVVLLPACAADPDGGHPAGSVGPDGAVDPALLAPLTGLGPCTDPPPALADETGVDGLVLPPTGIVTDVNRNGPLTQVRGYVERTPVEVRVFFADGSAGLEVLTIEDEVREAEVLATDGTTRMFLKVQAVCERGSFFVAFVAPAGAADLLPEPALGGN
jgi:hypothetical protein